MKNFSYREIMTEKRKNLTLMIGVILGVLGSLFIISFGINNNYLGMGVSAAAVIIGLLFISIGFE